MSTLNGVTGAPLVTGPFPEENTAPTRPGHASELASAFSEFIAAAARLENSYRQLQEEVIALRGELSAQNAALTHSLAENRHMHLHLQQIVDAMPCGVLVVDQDNVVSMINPEAQRLLALDTRTLANATLRDISIRSGMNLEAWSHTASGEQESQEFCLRDAFASRWIEVRHRRLLPQDAIVNDATQTIFILRDITAQRRDEQERIAGRKAMALAEMTTILAHEIRNPLASLELFAELIENEPARRHQWISNLRAGIRTLAATANNVLSVHGSGVLQVAPLPLAASIKKAVRFMQPLADQADVSLDWPDAQQECFVMGNDSALQQIVFNLLSNAIRHTPAGGAVRIAMTRHRQEVLVEFADTGCGIPPDQLDHIFEPGFSGSGDTSGLGLAVCQQIMQQHDGAISVAPAPEGGAHFALHFPLFARGVATA